MMKSADSTSYHRRLMVRFCCLDALSTYDYETSWKQFRKRGSPTWFTQVPDYQQWKEQLYCSVLYLKGILGSGKTILMASMIDDLNLAASQAIVAYFFCRHDISESMKARTVIGSLARQLLQQTDSIDRLVSERISAGLDFPEICELVERALSDRSKVCYFVLDGVDECEDNELDELIPPLRRLLRKVNLQICMSFRNSANFESKRLTKHDLGQYLTISIPLENPDIAEFIGAELESGLESGRLCIGNPAIILEILEALRAGAQGMWAFPTSPAWNSIKN